MIEYRNGVFALHGNGYAYLFRRTALGQLEHLHFGADVSIDDAPALACKPGTGWGDSVLCGEGEARLCLDTLPLEWSGSGRGDYRESPIQLSAEGEPIPTDFRYAAHEILSGIAPMSLPQANTGGETLHITLAQTDGLRLHLYYTAFREGITRRAVLENGSKRAITVHKLMSFCLDLPGKLRMTSFGGGWACEMRESTVPVGYTRAVCESTTGFSSSRAQAGFLLSAENASEESGTAYGINLIYSGNHYASAQGNLCGLNRVQQGISPDHFAWPLAPGERFETPEAVLCWSSAGFGGVSRRMHAFVNRHIVPAYWRYRERPVLFNSWEGCGFDFDEARLLALGKKARALGCELFVLDDGWFGQRDSDLAGLGDYHVNTRKLPHGLGGLANGLEKLGLQFGLWFEPECVNPDSDLYRAHPDWALTDDMPPVYGRNQLHLDLTREEVRDYIVKSVCAVLDSAPIRYVKWDMNRSSIALGARAHRYILGLYDVLHRIFDTRPEILLESCSSGGNRFDLGMLCFSPQIWCSDNTDAVERLQIQTNLSLLYPQSTFGAHVSASPNAQTLRSAPLYTRGNVAMFGCFGYELDLKELLPTEEREIEWQISFYKRWRSVLQFGVFRRVHGDSDTVQWQACDKGVTVVGLYHLLQHTAPGYESLRVPGLRTDRRYTLETRGQLLRVSQFGSLINWVTPMHVSPNGALARTADRRYCMEDGTQTLTATGAALMNGVMLEARYTGTGYTPALRLHSDFGSNVYVIKEVPADGKTEQEK